ncbi:hypothetical protein FRC07_003580 [Ceratobasidium sp. 392]|nr:hypothetical protein FRC07_003580 [Ceratobasidium sp. 392]
MEKDLRRATCGDALESLRNLLGIKALTLDLKKRHVRGQVPTTRSESALRAHSAKIIKTRWRFDNSRNALVRLGLEETDRVHYQELKTEHCKYLKPHPEDISRGVGQGYSSIPWIWRSCDSGNASEWQINEYSTLKTEWFGSRERYKRWEEQLVLLKREMTMTIRTFRKREEIWNWKARTRCPTLGMRGYALKQSRFYGELARRSLRAFQPHIKVSFLNIVA